MHRINFLLDANEEDCQTPKFSDGMLFSTVDSPNYFRDLLAEQKKHKLTKPALVIKFEDNLVAINFSGVSAMSSLTQKNPFPWDNPSINYERCSLRLFLSSVSNLYNVVLFSSMDSEIVKQLARDLGIDVFVEEYIGNISQPQKISLIDLPFSLEGRLDPSRTLLIDNNREMIQMNKDIGILVGLLKAERKEVDLLFLLPFLVYMSKGPEMQPINLYYQEYEGLTANKSSQARKKAESLPTPTLTEIQENLKTKVSKTKIELDETEADDTDRAISSMHPLQDSYKSVGTLKIAINLSHLRYLQIPSKVFAQE